MSERRVFVDLDGVLADFDQHYFRSFGTRLNRNGKEPRDLWDNIRTHGDWFAALPPMPDAMELWAGLRPYRPVILSGLNTDEYPEGAAQKRAWVTRYLGADVVLHTCRSRNKCHYAAKGDVLVDDWMKYRHLWEERGGVFILHTSAVDSLQRLAAL